MIIGEPIYFDTNDHDPSMYFKNLCKEAGYNVLKVMPVYYQGWDMDEWAAEAEKDGKLYLLTTNMGKLEEKPFPDKEDLEDEIIGILRYFNEINCKDASTGVQRMYAQDIIRAVLKGRRYE